MGGSRIFTNPRSGSCFTLENIRNMIDVVNEEGHGLTAWEESFMISLTDQFDRTQNITEAQLTSLEDIYTNRTD